jgi:hypothetical protein
MVLPERVAEYHPVKWPVLVRARGYVQVDPNCRDLTIQQLRLIG